MTASRIALCLLLSLGLGLPAHAALPPEYQRQAELEAVLELAVDVFGPSRLVDGISYLDIDFYEVKAGECTLEVRIVDKPSPHLEGFAGPRQFDTQAGDPVCP